MDDINYTSSRKIANLIDIPVGLSDNIVNYRKENGPFQTFDDLMNIDGITRTVMKRVKNKMKLKKSAAKKNTVSKNVTITGKKGSKKITSAKVERNKISKFNPIMFPLLRFDNTGSSPMSAGPSPVTMYTPVKIQPSKSGNKIMAEYRVLSPDTETETDDSKTFSSHLSTKVNASSIFKCKKGRPNVNNYRTLSQNKENSIRSWLKRIQPHSPISNPPMSRSLSPQKGILHHNVIQDHNSSRRKQSKDGNVQYSLSKLNTTRRKQVTSTGNTPQRHSPRKENTNTIIGTNRQRLCDQGIDRTGTKRIRTLAKSHHKSTPRRKHNAMENAPNRPYGESVYMVTGSSPRSLSRGTHSMSNRQTKDSFEQLQTRTPDSLNDQTYICRSSVVRERSVTPVSPASIQQESDCSVVSSDASLLHTHTPDREHAKTRGRKRHRSRGDKEKHRRHRSPRRNRHDDQAPVCSIL